MSSTIIQTPLKAIIVAATAALLCLSAAGPSLSNPIYRLALSEAQLSPDLVRQIANPDLQDKCEYLLMGQIRGRLS